jgi:D-serine deaminase-like pyridoxal phosphate-dependent protein
MPRADGSLEYGRVALFGDTDWGAPIEGAWLRSLSQEHGVVRADPAVFSAVFAKLRVGDLLAVVPIHSCLTSDLLKKYLTLEGTTIDMMATL